MLPGAERGALMQPGAFGRCLRDTALRMLRLRDSPLLTRRPVVWALPRRLDAAGALMGRLKAAVPSCGALRQPARVLRLRSRD